MIDVHFTDNTSLWDIADERGVRKFRWVTHPELVKQVCPQCMHLEGTTWSADDASAPEAPLHPLCACTIEPVFDEGTVLGRDPDGEPIVSEPVREYQPGEFLREQVQAMPAAKQDQVLGKGRARLLRSGLVDPESLVNLSTGMRTVADLARSLGLTLRQIHELSYEKLRELAERRLKARRNRRVRPSRRGREGNDALGNLAFSVVSRG